MEDGDGRPNGEAEILHKVKESFEVREQEDFRRSAETSTNSDVVSNIGVQVPTEIDECATLPKSVDVVLGRDDNESLLHANIATDLVEGSDTNGSAVWSRGAGDPVEFAEGRGPSGSADDMKSREPDESAEIIDPSGSAEAGKGPVELIEHDDRKDPEVWLAVQQELLSHQSLTSVINATTGESELQNPGDVWTSIAKQIETQIEKDQSRYERRKERLREKPDLLGPIPKAADFEMYLDGIEAVWLTFAKGRRGDGVAGMPTASEACSEALKTAYNAVPEIFFQEDFNVDQLHIFSEDIDKSAGRQEELNEHIEVIEVALFELAHKFPLLDSIGELGDPMKVDLLGALSAVQSLRQRLTVLKKSQVRIPAFVCHLVQRQHRIDDVIDKLDTILHLQESQPRIQMLLRTQEHSAAMELIESGVEAVQQKLAGLICAKPVKAELNELMATLDGDAQRDFIDNAVQMILSKAGQSTEVLVKLICHVKSRGCLGRVLGSKLCEALQEHVQKCFREWIPQVLTTVAARGRDSNEESDSNAQAEATSSVVSLQFDAFRMFWQNILERCHGTMVRLLEFIDLVKCTSPENIDAEAAHNNFLTHTGELIQLCEALQGLLLQKAGVLLTARQDVHQTVGFPEWREFLTLTDRQIDKMLEVRTNCLRTLQFPADLPFGPEAKDALSGLQSILFGQTKALVDEFHQQHVATLEVILDQEKWERVDVPVVFKREVVMRLMGQTLPDTKAEPEASETEQAENQEVERQLSIGEVNFLVVPAVLILLQDVHEYVELSVDLPSVATESAQRMIQLLKLFHRKTTELILQGAAVKTKKTITKITATILALCSQCCGLIVHILPALQTWLSKEFDSTRASKASGNRTEGAEFKEVKSPAIPPVPVVAALNELGSVTTDFNDLKQSLFQKLSDILCTAYESHSRKWLGSPHHEVPSGAAPSQAPDGVLNVVDLHPHEALQGLVKDFSSMNRVLLKALAVENVRKIFAKAFADIAVKFEKQLEGKMEAPSPPYEGRMGRSSGDRMAMDLAFLFEQLGQLTGIELALQHLIADMMQHLRTSGRFRSVQKTDDPTRCLNLQMLEALQKAGRLPKPQRR